MQRLSWLMTAMCLCCCLLSLRGAEERAEDDGPLPPEEAAATMSVPDGFQVTLFAGEPDVRQPIGFCIDDRGRLWVAEAYSYPNHTDESAGDRIVIFEDAGGDGRFDKRTVFYEGLNYVTGIEVGFGGAWVMSPPYFYFIPDRDGDGVPDGPPQVLLDGFGNHANAHNLANGFSWGPDGWLYGTHGRTNWSMLGTPGTPEEERVRFDGGVWRYHPVRHVWEPFSDGTTNPFGLDWDDYGEAFACSSVDPHLFHHIQGAHYEPWRNRESSLHAYQRIDTIADHLHYVGADHRHVGTGEEDAAGGGHAHAGTMVYLGDNWPERYRNTVFLNNIHGNRINNDRLQRSGSGYVATHEPDLMIARDPGFRGTAIRYGPDGGVYVTDWSDTNDCHSTRGVDRQFGRIYKITYGSPEKQDVDVVALSNQELVELQLHRNDWWVRHSRRVLQERYAEGKDMSRAHKALHRTFDEQSDVTRKLRAMWTLHATGGLDDAWLINQLDHESQYVRAWAVRLLCEDYEPPQRALERFRELAESDDSPFVRRHLASALQRLDKQRRWPIAEALVTRYEDREDQNLPQMVWYAVEPLVHDDLPRFVQLAAAAEIPLIRRHVARRVASLKEPAEGLEVLAALLSDTRDATSHHDLLDGMLRGLEGRRTVAMPPSWPDAYARLMHSERDSVRERALHLALIFDDPVALDALREQAADDSLAEDVRKQAIDALVSRQVEDLAPLLLALVLDPATRSSALQGLAQYDHPQTASTILDTYPAMTSDQRQQALQTLASRPDWASRLLDAVEANEIPRSDLTAYTARQLRNLDDKQLVGRVNKLWGEVRETSADRARQIEDYKRRLTPETLQQADLVAGRMTFQERCASCHRLFDSGGEIGPDITGSHRSNLDYILENIIDPSASVAKDYQMELIYTVRGRVVSGLVAEETETAVTLVTETEEIVIPLDEIESRETSSLSMMPDGLLNELSFREVRDLLAYLASPQQVPLPADVTSRAVEGH